MDDYGIEEAKRDLNEIVGLGRIITLLESLSTEVERTTAIVSEQDRYLSILSDALTESKAEIERLRGMADERARWFCDGYDKGLADGKAEVERKGE
jgi:hypothetical protein